MKTLITIDLDYWTNCYKRINRDGIDLLKEIKKASGKCYSIWYHHHILDLIPAKTGRVINIDFHNDIVGEDLDPDEGDDTLNEGTWGNFLPPSVERFEWYYPNHKKCVTDGGGLCVGTDGLVSTEYPVEYKQKQKWQSMDFSSATTFVLCISPQWAFEHSYSDYMDALNIKATERDRVVKF